LAIEVLLNCGHSHIDSNLHHVSPFFVQYELGCSQNDTIIM
jgi:hypothetical protein